MSKGVYFFFQIFLSIIVSSIVWYFYPASGTFNFSLTGNYKEDGMIFIGGAVVYLVITIVHMILGRETLKNWSKAIPVVVLIIGVIMFVAGKFTCQYAVDLLNSTLNLGLYIGL
jgi:hypothetical protein